MIFTHLGKVPMRLPKLCWPVSAGGSGRMAWRAHWELGPWDGLWSPAPWSARTRRWWTATHRTLQPSLLIFWLLLPHYEIRGKALYFHKRRGRRWGQVCLKRFGDFLYRILSGLVQVPATKLYHLPFLITSFMPWSSAAANPYPRRKTKIKLTSLQISKIKLKLVGNFQRRATSTIPIKKPGTMTKGFFQNETITVSNKSPKNSFTGLSSSNFTAFKNFRLSRVKRPKKWKSWNIAPVMWQLWHVCIYTGCPQKTTPCFDWL